MIALVAGIVLGAWQPRGEVLAMRAELDELRAAGGPCRGGAAQSLREILRADGPTLEAAAGERRRVRNVAGADGTPTAPAEGETFEAEADAEPAEPAETPEEMRNAMHTALDARRAQAMAALVEQGDLDDAEVDAVNAAMDQMNADLKAEVDAFVEDALETGEVDRRDIMEFAAEALDVVLVADDQMREAVPPEVYAEVEDGTVDPFSYVSGDTLDSIARLEGIAGPVFE